MGPQVVYVPPPPPAASPAQSTQAIVIQAPAPSAPPEVASEPAQPQAQVPESPRHVRSKRPLAKVPEPEPEPADVPALQSSLSPSRATELQGQVVRLQQGIEKRILRLSREWLSPPQRSTLEGARGFLQLSQRALQESDLQRANNLADKADLLVKSIEESQ